jgi:TrmH RNA methyltransferase
LPRFKECLRFCAEQRIAYHIKTAADLDQIAETVHHDGVLFLARKQREATVDDVIAWTARLRPQQSSVIVVLESVKNPHNLGAILRVCAHFGVPWVLRAGQTPALSPAAMRTAEGGAEHSLVVGANDGEVGVGDIVSTLRRLKDAGYTILATSSHATLSLGHERLPPRAVVLFGAEGEGLSPALQRLADDVISIPGSGALESLNVACAASVVLWELWRSASASASSSAASRAAPLPQRQHSASEPPTGERPRPAGPRRGNGSRRGGPRA